VTGDADRRSAVCDAVGTELPELALGTLSGRHRVAALEHVAVCARCEAEVEQLTIVADSLLRLAPEVEPPVGFEVRLFDRLGLSPDLSDDEPDEPVPLEAARRRRRRPWATVVGAVAAAVVALAVGFGAGWWASPGPTAPSTSASGSVHVAQLESSTQLSGQAITYASSPAWLLMTVDGPGATGNVTCKVRLANGTDRTVGTFWIEQGYGSWAAPLPVPSSEVRSARLVDARGATLATARF
jgi:hypothetical protein